MRRLVLFLILTGIATADVPKDPYAAWRDKLGLIVGGAYDGKAFEQLADLSDGVGARLSGSPGHERGIEWATRQLKAAGVQDVKVERFTFEHSWQRGSARASIVAPARSLHVESLAWSPSTAGVLRAPIVVVENIEFLPPAAQLAGKIVLIDLGQIAFDGRWASTLHKTIGTLARGKAVAMLRRAASPNNVLGTFSPFDAGKLMPFPAATIGMEDGQLLARLAKKGPVTVELALSNAIGGPVQVGNVIGELRGRDKPDEWVLLGAHLDSWDFATGTQDNGSGVVTVLQSARLLAAAGPLRRTVRFALWGGEEQGDVGSRAYAVAHAVELDRCIVALNSDDGAGHVTGWNVFRRADVKTWLAPVSERVLASLGGTAIKNDMYSSTDHFPFLAAGVPVLDLAVEDASYEVVHHRPADTIDKVDRHSLASGVAVFAATSYVIAQSTERIAPRLDRKALEPLLKPEFLDEYLVYVGWWK